MQSLASLLSIKQTDIGNLEDFIDSDEDASEERRASFGTGQAFTGKRTRNSSQFLTGSFVRPSSDSSLTG